MKLAILLIFMLTMGTYAATNAQNVTITLQQSTVKDMLIELRKQTDYHFVYDEQVIGQAPLITLSAQDTKLEDVLKDALHGIGFDYRLRGKNVTVFPKPVRVSRVKAASQSGLIEVRGTVQDSEGVLQGVNVIVKNRPAVGTSTDGNGRYILEVPDDAVLVFRYMGYTTQEIAVNGQTLIDVTMAIDTEGLEEVVVVGFGTQKKASVVGAITTVKPEELNVPSSSLSQSFAGRLAGVLAVQRSGEPGRDDASFWVRGIATLGSTNPLVFMDGIEISLGDMNRIDPVNIESFSILKDASATALYGARGANGVILIETKRGTSNGQLRISAQIENSLVQPTQLPQYTDAVTFMNLYNEARSNVNPFALPKFTQEKIDGTANRLDDALFPDVQWMNTLFKDIASRQHANLNIRGGINRLKYYMGASLYNDRGILQRTTLSDFDNNITNKRYNFVNNISVEASKTTEVELNLTADIVDYNGPAVDASDIFSNVMNSNPVRFPIVWPNDDPSVTYPMFGNIIGGLGPNGTFVNPYADLVKGYKTRAESMVLATLRVNQDLSFILPGLKANALASFKNWTQSEITRQYDPYYFQLDNFYINPETGLYDYGVRVMGDGGREALEQEGATSGNRTQFYQATTTYNQTFASKHEVGGLLVYFLRQFDTNIPSYSIIESLSRRNVGLAGRATYAYDSRYLVEANFGYNGSENFAAGKRMGFFPSIAVGYIVSNEQFFEPLKGAVSNLKLRASYGVSGNDQIGASRFPYLSDVDINNEARGFTFGQNFNNHRNGVYVNRYPNIDVTWERGAKSNAGIDIELFGQFGLIADVFREIRSGIFLQREQVPATLGIGNAQPYANLGKVRNQGLDLTMTYNKSFNADFFLSARGVFTFARNKVLERDEPQRLYAYQNRTGRPVHQLWGLPAERLFIDQAEVDHSPRQSFSGLYYPGDIKYADTNNDGVIDDNDRVAMGYPSVPEITYGFGLNGRYKKFDVGLLFQGIGRTSFFVSNIQPFGQYERNVLAAVADSHWSKDNPDLYAFYPRLSEVENPNNQQNSTWWLRRGDFLRLKTVELGYSANRYLRIYANGLNLFSISDFNLWDPEMGGGNGLGYPPQRTFNLGLQINL